MPTACDCGTGRGGSLARRLVRPSGRRVSGRDGYCMDAREPSNFFRERGATRECPACGQDREWAQVEGAGSRVGSGGIARDGDSCHRGHLPVTSGSSNSTPSMPLRTGSPSRAEAALALQPVLPTSPLALSRRVSPRKLARITDERRHEPSRVAASASAARWIRDAKRSIGLCGCPIQRRLGRRPLVGVDSAPCRRGG
jgi:hypothetical protein